MSEDQSPYRVSPEGQAVTRKLDLDGLVKKGLADPDFARAYVEGLHEEVRAVCEENAALREENAKLKKRVDELEKRLEIDCCYVLPKDGGEDLVRKELSPEERKTFPDAIVSRDATIALIEDDLNEVVEKCRSLRSQRDRLREAIEPMIADVTDDWSGAPDDATVDLFATVGQCREARAAYEETSDPVCKESLHGDESDWEKDCIRWHGHVLTGERGHWCPDFDDLPIDETMEMEWSCCTCRLTDSARLTDSDVIEDKQ